MVSKGIFHFDSGCKVRYGCIIDRIRIEANADKERQCSEKHAVCMTVERERSNVSGA